MTTMQETRAHALYRFFDAEGALLYVGITNDPGRRWSDHRRQKSWWHEVSTVTVEKFETRATVLAAEADAIRLEMPRYNIVGAVLPTERVDVLVMPEGTQVVLCGCRRVEPFLNYSDGAAPAGLRVFHELTCTEVLAIDPPEETDLVYDSERYGTMLSTHTTDDEFVVFIRNGPGVEWARTVMLVLQGHRSDIGTPLTIDVRESSPIFDAMRDGFCSHLGEFKRFSGDQMRLMRFDRVQVSRELLAELDAACEEYDRHAMTTNPTAAPPTPKPHEEAS